MLEFLMEMKKLISIVAIILTLSCAKSKETVEVLNEKDAYILVNDFLIKELSTYENIILFNNRHLRPPAKEETYGKLEPIQMLDDPYPIFTKLYWNQEKISGVKIVEWETYNSYFQRNDSINMSEKWTEDFGHSLVYNVSYPIFNKQTKLAAIRVYAYASNRLCGTDLVRVYVYKKTKTDGRPLVIGDNNLNSSPKTRFSARIRYF